MIFENVAAAIGGHTLLDEARLRSLWRLAHAVANNAVPGDFVECGSYKGGSAAVLRAAMAQGRHLWIYDSFQGLPPPTEEDGEQAKQHIGDCVGTQDDVARILHATGASPAQYTMVKGWYQDTLKGNQLPQQVALLHCDADWYDSVLLVLETFYDRVMPGGAIILDDFGYWEGCRVAFYDFCNRRGLKPLLERVGSTQAWWIKGKAHTRQG